MRKYSLLLSSGCFSAGVLLTSLESYVARIIGIGLFLISIYLLNEWQSDQQSRKQFDADNYRRENTSKITVAAFLTFIVSSAAGLYFIYV
jgi:Na+/phosphate symporter